MSYTKTRAGRLFRDEDLRDRNVLQLASSTRCDACQTCVTTRGARPSCDDRANLDSFATSAPPRNREVETVKAQERAQCRFAFRLRWKPVIGEAGKPMICSPLQQE